jgi:hydroxymethylglutaryl-CoA synthase
MNNVGICSYGIKIPKKRLSVEETINVWKNSSLEFIEQNLNVKQRTVLDSDEDVITLSVEAAKRCLENSNMDPEKIESLYLGTTTAPDLFRANSTVIMDMLTSNGEYLNSDIQSSEKSGTSALIIGYSNVKSGITNNSLIIGADVFNRHVAPGDMRESYMGAGAGALMLSNENIIATIEGVSSYNSNFPEQVRSEDERFIRLIAQLHQEVIDEGFIKHSVKSVNLLFEKLNLKEKDFDYGVFQQFNGSNPFALGAALGFSKSKIIPSIFSDNTGDTGASSPLIGLAKVLDEAKPGQRILLCSYGHGTGSDAISLVVTEKIVDYQNNKYYSVQSELNDNLINVNYSEAMKYEFKYVQPDIALSPFL